MKFSQWMLCSPFNILPPFVMGWYRALGIIYLSLGSRSDMLKPEGSLCSCLASLRNQGRPGAGLYFLAKK